MRNQILRKSILFIIYCFLFVPGFAKDKGNLFEADMSSTYFDNQISILGINEEKCVLSYINSFISEGRGDIRYELIVFDYKNNTVLENCKKTWISEIYDEYGIEDWNNPKYSINAYEDYISEEIHRINASYNLIKFNSTTKEFSNLEVYLVSREKVLAWLENIIYRVKFKIKNKKYEYEESLSEVDFVKNIQIDKIYNLDKYYLIVQKLAHDTFEDADYFDYQIRGVLK